MICGGISTDGFSNLCIILNDILTVQRYADDKLISQIVAYASAIDDFILITHDNIKPYTAPLQKNKSWLNSN